MKMLMRKIHSGFNQAGSEASSDEEEENSEDGEEDDDEEQQPVPASVINISIYNKKTQRNELFRVLLDSGTLGCLATAEAVKRAGIKQQTATKPKSFRTAAGRFQTTHYAQVRQHRILELNSKRKLQRLKVNVAPGPLGLYDFILGRRYMTRYGIDLLFSQGKIEWDGMQMPMRSPEDLLSKEPTTYEKKLAVRENMIEDDDLTAATDLDMTDDEFEDDYGESEVTEAPEEHFAQHIADAQYAKADLESIVRSQKQLNTFQQDALLEVLKKFEDLFQGNLGVWPDTEIGATLIGGATPYHCQRPMRIPHAHYSTLKKEIDRLVSIGVLEEVDGNTAGPWCSPSFIIPKKDGTVRFITDYREVNRRIVRKPWPMPHIADLLQDIGRYSYVSALDLSMGYYHFKLDKKLQDMSTFVLPWGLYKYLRLPMGLSISPDLFQAHMQMLLAE